jgi:methenyltetrahydrofolate cyclohydrolase
MKKLPLIEDKDAGNKNYLDLKASELLDAFGEGNHIPGSGSAAILSSLIAIEMIKTVSQLSITKEEYKDKWEQMKYVQDIVLNDFKPRLIELFHSDIREFHKASYLRRQRDLAVIGSKERDAFARDAVEQLKIATDIPIENCEIAFRLLSHAIYIFENGFKGAKGDSGVAISNLLSSISGSLFIIFLNLKTFKKGKWKDEKMKRAIELANQFYETQRIAFSKVVEIYNESSPDEQPQLRFDF